MNTSRKAIFKRQHWHLILSVVVIVPIAITYGLRPDKYLPQLLDFKVETTDLSNVFRSIMGLYLAMVALWILGIFNPKYWLAATVSNILFMGGMACGRILSLILDGLPSTIFLCGIVGELTFALFGITSLLRYQKKVSKKAAKPKF